MPVGRSEPLYNIYVVNGNSLPLLVTWYADDVLVDNTGFSATFKCGRIALTSLSRVILGGAAGTYELELTASEVRRLGVGTHSYELRATESDGSLRTILKGSIIVTYSEIEGG